MPGLAMHRLWVHPPRVRRPLLPILRHALTMGGATLAICALPLLFWGAVLGIMLNPPQAGEIVWFAATLCVSIAAGNILRHIVLGLTEQKAPT